MTAGVAPTGWRHSLAGHAAGMVAARGVYAVSRWAIIMLMARQGSTQMVGAYGLGIAIALPVFGLLDLQLRSVQATDAHGLHPFGECLALRLLTVALAMGVIALVGVSLYGGPQALAIALVGALRGVESLADVCYGAMQQRLRLHRMAISTVLRSMAVSAAALVTLWAVGPSLPGVVVAMTLASLLVWVSYDLPTVARLPGDDDGRRVSVRPVFAWRRLMALAWLALPLGLVMMLLMLQFNLPRYVLEHHHGLAALGIFAGIAYFVDGGQQFVIAIGNTFSPRLARSFAHGRRREFLRLWGVLTLVCVTPGLAALMAAWLCGPWLLATLLSPDYAPHHDLFIVMMLAATLVFAYTAAGFTMTATRWFRSSMIPAMIGVALSLTLSLWLIPTHGLMGAGWTLVALAGASWMLLMMVVALALRRHGSTPAWPHEGGQTREAALR